MHFVGNFVLFTALKEFIKIGQRLAKLWLNLGKIPWKIKTLGCNGLIPVIRYIQCILDWNVYQRNVGCGDCAGLLMVDIFLPIVELCNLVSSGCDFILSID